MKFGGTSVADPEKIQRAAERVRFLRKSGASIVVVVSAPGEMTDELLTLARRVSSVSEGRELDQLLSTGEQVGISLFAMALIAQGTPAVSLTGPQAGILTGGPHTRAHIVRINTAKILSELGEGRVVTVAGFQGATENDAVATLGRGGSDLTAVALASALKALACEIYTDVKGVYTADPRIVYGARKIARLTSEEMLELAGAGAQVMQSRSIELAQARKIPLHVRSAFHPGAGTWIVPARRMNMKSRALEKASVSSLALDKGEVRLSILDVPDKPGVAAEILSALARQNIPIDMIIQSAPSRAGINALSFMTPRSSAAKAQQALAMAARDTGGRVELDEHVAKVSAVGTGFRHHPWVAAKMFETLAKSRINIHMIAASDLRISCVVDSRHAETALRLLHQAYGLSAKR